MEEFVDKNTHIIITTIHAPNRALRMYVEGAGRCGASVLVVGDDKTPEPFELSGVEYYSVGRQIDEFGVLADRLPRNHYARKNLGYLAAIEQGARIIVETDDDNLPYESFWEPRALKQQAPVVRSEGWVNAYRYFTDEIIWPRGFPLEEVKSELPSLAAFSRQSDAFYVQQGLANRNPDVDAIFRLTRKLPVDFETDLLVALGAGTWCPFNSQNTTWFEAIFPLLYLPSTCSFRMTDIWRGFVAQRIMAENDWPILFHGPTVWQERNEHDLMRDFSQEIEGYLSNDSIRSILQELKLEKGKKSLICNLRRCYEALIQEDLIENFEEEILGAWCAHFES